MTQIIENTTDETNNDSNQEICMELNNNIKDIFEKYINYLYSNFEPDNNFLRFNDFYVHEHFQESENCSRFKKLLSFFIDSEHYSHLSVDKIKYIIFLSISNNEFNEFVDRLVEELKEKERINSLWIK